MSTTQSPSSGDRIRGNAHIHELIAAWADHHPDAVALAAPGRAPLTYAGLRKHIERTVVTLNGMGVGRNDRVAAVLRNGPDLASTFVCVASAATFAPLNPAYTAHELEFYLSDLNAKALIVQSDMDSAAIAVARELGVALIQLSPATDAEAGIFDLTAEPKPAPAQGGLAEADDVALVLHTSGTTSRPKIVPLSHANICTSAQNIATTLGLAPDDRCLNVMPLFHIHGLIGATLSSLASGASVICTPGFSADEFFSWLGEFQPTWYTAVPTMHQAIVERAAANQVIIRACPLRLVRSSSASLRPAVMQRLEETFSAPAIESYGMTEASHQMASSPLPPGQRKPGSVGLAAGPEVAIMDDEGHLLPAGETGEIVIRGPSVMKAYEANPEANESAFCNGWFRTGDQGFLDSDGYLFITGRIKEIINRGGEKIAPREVDEALLEHPEIAQAVTFAVPHPTLGEDVAVAIVLRHDASLAERDIRSLAFDRLAEHKVPGQVAIVDEVPKGPTGKLQRIGLADKLADKLRADLVAPRNDCERAVARTWADVLGLESVGVHDNFFALGGDSLSAVRVASRLQAAFHVEPPIKLMFEEPTVAGQALVIEEMLIDEIDGLPDDEARRLTG